MSEWQPARLKMVHDGPTDPPEDIAEMLSKVVRVRKYPDGKQPGFSCSGDKWFEIHPDDCDAAARGLDHVLVCEHEILTD